MPYHVLLDTAGETKLGKLSIGTTRRGIGPCYADKALRLGIRVQDLLDEKILRTKIRAALEPKQQALRELSVQRRKLRKEAGEEAKRRPRATAGVPDPRLDLHTMVEEHVNFGHRLEPHIADTAQLCWDALDARRDGDLRGRPGDPARPRPRHLSLRHLLQPDRRRGRVGAGVGPTDIDEVWGIAKAYATRVGAGPFPTELDDEIGERMVERGHEFGTTTGRRRRCGWMDLVALRYAVRLNRMDALAITKLDVLSGIGPLRVAVRYRSKEGAVLDSFPYHQSILHSATPEYEELPGFDEDIGACRERGRPAARRRATTSASSPTSSACRSAWSASGPTATRRLARVLDPSPRDDTPHRILSLLYSLWVASSRRAAKLSERLPRGRHGLPREAVTESQRNRIHQAMIEVVSERGYPETRVVDVIGVAGVSRKTFYELFDSKEDCFLAAYDVLLGNLLGDTADGFESQAGSAVGGAGRGRRWGAARPPRRASRRGALRDRRGAGGGPEGAGPARRGAAPVHRLPRVGPGRDRGRAARDHLALARRRRQRAPLQRDPPRRRGAAAEPPART